MTANPFAALLRDVPRYDGYWTFDPDGDVVRLSDVLAALAAAVPDDLAEVGKVLEGVTPGPWAWNTRGFVGPTSTEDDQSFGMICDEVAECTFSDGAKEANARFIAWCREGVPALLARIAAQEAQIKGLAMDVLAEWEKDQRFIKELCDQIEQLNAKVADWSVRAEAAETALSAERAKVARLVEALNQYQLAAAGYVSVQSAKDKADAVLSTITEAGQ